MASLAAYQLPEVDNEPNKHFLPASAERVTLATALAKLASNIPHVPLVINGEEVKGTTEAAQKNPANHAQTVCTYALASMDLVRAAIKGALEAKNDWEKMPFHARAAIFLKAADLVSTKYRMDIIAATMLGQGKNAWQGEIDAAAELIDFLRFNCKYAQELYATQPPMNSTGIWNRSEYRPLEGFIYAVSPFNFTAIGGNLSCAPALLGNVVIWKPSPSAVLSNYLVHKILMEAGLPRGVIQFLPGDAQSITNEVLRSPDFVGLHFTGSTNIFKMLWKKIAANIDLYKSYPRIVGETGGKDFHLIDSSADVTNAVVATVRGAFEYQGQKCSACSRVYVPETLWPKFSKLLKEETEKLQVGNPCDWVTFVGPVIHESAFDKLSTVIDNGKLDPELELITGGKHDKSKGYFIHPTVFKVNNIHHRMLQEEYFGPVLGVYVYPDPDIDTVLAHIDQESKYALTGSVFAQDRAAIEKISAKLRYAAGNFYINDKCTGAVVGQQPFGGARASGTNDKAGSAGLLSRFVSVRSIKENFIYAENVRYPSNEL
ncbi:Delta-1-pyrroline-5-carboxylate dehydrogenase, mitochondrial [Neolecta irregularis DAH-3]|uniref:Multifunctional fusion protein n=1 Tax=Neolecta irregularis (strain DAH-3) TaxID=1198029 RepID=A0A1U7LGY8_NEOID|nr:Delta-1-pyrroline-5-carboxylate dehydrogenase, mitochondrial [Neolecta irregularis DAH-3]|eukprot:OLL21909.1 Delta-1-pyrroline-5-carboxylate dehydrogenase, mitochondrial [Neolecta irregularis DAH-3]